MLDLVPGASEGVKYWGGQLRARNKSNAPFIFFFKIFLPKG